MKKSCLNVVLYSFVSCPVAIVFPIHPYFVFAFFASFQLNFLHKNHKSVVKNRFKENDQNRTVEMSFFNMLLSTLVCSLAFAVIAEADNWAVIVSGSRYWHNYRHGANALTLYHLAKENGIPDERIMMMLGESYSCDPRNYLPATVYNDKSKSINLHNCDTEIDMQGYEVSVATFNEVLQGRYVPSTPNGRVLKSNNESNVLIFMSGHGNQGFIKFHDTQYYTSDDLADSFAIMHAAGSYRKILLIVDTCNAESMCLQIRSPNIVCIASSTYNQPSYAHHGDDTLGIQVIDTFSFDLLGMLGQVGKGMKREDMPLEMAAERDRVLSKSLWDLFAVMPNTKPALHPAINDRDSLKTWTLGEFLSDGEEPVAVKRMPIRDLF